MVATVEALRNAERSSRECPVAIAARFDDLRSGLNPCRISFLSDFKIRDGTIVAHIALKERNQRKLKAVPSRLRHAHVEVVASSAKEQTRLEGHRNRARLCDSFV